MCISPLPCGECDVRNGTNIWMLSGCHEPGVHSVDPTDERPEVLDSVVLETVVSFEDDVDD